MPTLSFTRGKVAAGLAVLAMPVGAGVVASPASAADFSCPFVSTVDNHAVADCVVHSGEVRVRADCKVYPDLYSPWVGRGAWHLTTGRCPFGIRGAIVEARG
jgi:hypothetical protein